MDPPYQPMMAMKTNIKMLYFQGLWPEDPNPDLDFYLQFFPQSAARLLMRRPYLRTTLSFLLKSHPWTMITLAGLQLFTSLADILLGGGTSLDVFENACVTIQATFFMATLSAFMRKTRVKAWFNVMEKVTYSVAVDEDELRILFNRGWAQRFSHKSTRYWPISVFIFVAIGSAIHIPTDLYPQRKFFVRGWFPYDATATPAYELTLAVLTYQNTMMALTLTTMLCTSLFMFNYVGVHFKILANMLKNIRESSMEKVFSDAVTCCGHDHKSRGRTLQGHYSQRVLRSLIDEGYMQNEVKLCRRVKGVDKTRTLLPPRLIEMGHRQISEGGKPAMIDRPHRNRYIPKEGRPIMITRPDGNRYIPKEGKPEMVNRLDRNRYISKEGRPEMITRPDKNRYISNGIRPPLITRSYRSKKKTKLGRNMKFTETFQNINTSTSKITSSSHLHAVMHCQLREFVKLHQTLLSSARDVGSLMKMQLIVLLVGSIFAAAGATIVVSYAEAFGFREIFLLAFISGLVVNFFWFSFVADFLATQSSAILDASYECDWLKTPKSFKKNMQIIMIRATRPLEIKPPGLDPLSLQNFGLVSIQAYRKVSNLQSILS